MSAMDLAQKYPEQFLARMVFPDLFVDEFRFGRMGSGNSTCLNVISQYAVESVRPNRLAIHLNCIVKASTLQKNTITIHVQFFHVTARSFASQQKIDAHGPSVITADNSIHCSISTKWGRAANLKALAREIGIDENRSIESQIPVMRAYNKSWVQSLAGEFKGKVELRIHQLLGAQIEVKWKGDKSFPTK